MTIKFTRHTPDHSGTRRANFTSPACSSRRSASSFESRASSELETPNLNFEAAVPHQQALGTHKISLRLVILPNLFSCQISSSFPPKRVTSWIASNPMFGAKRLSLNRDYGCRLDAQHQADFRIATKGIAQRVSLKNHRRRVRLASSVPRIRIVPRTLHLPNRRRTHQQARGENPFDLLTPQ